MQSHDHSTFAAWEAGDLSDTLALRAIWSDLREVESQIAPLEAERAHLREQISRIVARTGTIELPGLGRALITAPARTVSYDARAISILIAEIAATHPDIASRLSAAQKVSDRSGSLRIEAERAEARHG